MNPRAGLDDMGKWTFLNLTGLQLRSLGRPVRSRLSYRYAMLPRFQKKQNSSNFFFKFNYCIFTIYSRYINRVISKRDECEYLKQVPSIDSTKFRTFTKRRSTCGSLPWEPPTGYPSNSPITRISMVTNYRNYTWIGGWKKKRVN
jgi:hypothetical protein